MNLFLAVTDADWFRFLKARSPLEEVNFWRPGGSSSFRALQLGEPLLFKLHYPVHQVVGGGFFAHYSREVPVSLAWEAFGEKNGAPTFQAMRQRIEKYRRIKPEPHEDYKIGCILLSDPFFFEREDWIPVPDDWSKNIVQGKGYDARSGYGAALWDEVQLRLMARRAAERGIGDAPGQEPMYGDPRPVRPRLGQGAFRVLVTDTYQRRCAVTGERALPVLEAAHVRPVSEGGRHQVDNGLLLRSDVHRLFDRGYVTVTPDYRFRVSRRLREEFDNGEPYYPFDRQQIWLPGQGHRPSREFLAWHSDSVFHG